jgi:hypothetical protein
MSVSQLPFGDRMSLKGKLFELQKKLNLLEIDEKVKEEQGLTFRPVMEAASYKQISERPKDFFTNVQKAELIRKVYYFAFHTNYRFYLHSFYDHCSSLLIFIVD